MPQLQVFLSDENEVSQDLTEERITVGRLADNTLRIEDASISSHHAELLLEGGKYRLQDLGSTNGTFVNEGQIKESIILNHGDQVRFGRIVSVYLAEDDSNLSHPLPETSGLAVQAGQQSARPVNFVSSSPVARGAKKRDLAGAALYALFTVAVLACAAAAYFVFALEIPA